MRTLPFSLIRVFGHVSRTPLSTRSLPMRRRYLVLALMACCLPAAVLARGTRYRFTSFNVPGATQTIGDGINNVGAIVGYFVDASGGFHGYILSVGGVFTQINVPGAVKTIVEGINNPGTMVGQYDAPVVGQTHGFVLSGGIFTSFDVPGATFTAGKGINLAGVTVGYYVEAAGTTHGFLLNSGRFTTIDYPNERFPAAVEIAPLVAPVERGRRCDCGGRGRRSSRTRPAVARCHRTSPFPTWGWRATAHRLSLTWSKAGFGSPWNCG